MARDGARIRPEAATDVDPSERCTRSLADCALGQRVVGCRSSWKFSRRRGKGGCSTSTVGGCLGTFARRTSCIGRWRSLRAVPRVWGLLVWEQAGNINSECVSRLGSWSFQTRIPRRTHAQHYGAMCGILESVHKVRVSVVECRGIGGSAQEGALVRSPLRDDCEGWKAWLRGQAGVILVPHVATVARQAHLDMHAGMERKRCLHTPAHHTCSESSILCTCWVQEVGDSSCVLVTFGQI